MTGMKRRNRRRRASTLVVLGALTLLASGARTYAADAAAGRIERIELKADGASTKVVVMLSRPIAFDVNVLDGDPARKSARRLVLDFPDTTLAAEAAKPITVASDLLRQIRPGQFNAKTARIVLDLGSDATHSVDAFETPPHVTIALAGTATGGAPPAAPAVAAPPPAAEAVTVGAPPANVPSAATGTATAGALSSAAKSVVAAPAPAPGASESAKAPVRPIPIRARGRRPYSLNYWR